MAEINTIFSNIVANRATRNTTALSNLTNDTILPIDTLLPNELFFIEIGDDQFIPKLNENSKKIIKLLDVEKARIDGILSGALANLNTFTEIVALINSVDTTNDTAFATYVLSNDGVVSNIISGTTPPAKANAWTNARTISLSGDVSGTMSVDGSINVNMLTTVANDSHTHDGRYFTETESDARFVNVAGDSLTGSILWSGSQPFNGLYWGTQFKDELAHVGQMAYIRQSSVDGQLELGSDQSINIYETDSRVLAVAIDTNAMSLDAKGFLAEAGIALDQKYLQLANSSAKADAWSTSRILTLDGDVSGSASIDGASDVTLTVVIADDSHNHDGRYFTETEADARYINTAGDTMTGVLNMGANITRTTGNGLASWMQQDGSGRQHWYWNSTGGLNPLYTDELSEGASSISQHVDLQGGYVFFRSAVPGIAPDPISWITTLRVDINDITFKGNDVWHAGNDGAGTQLDAGLFAGQLPTYYSAINSASALASDALRVSGTTLSLYKGDGSFETVTTQDTIYSLPTSVVHDTEASALHQTDALRLTGTTISLYKGDGSFESVTVPVPTYTHPTYTGQDASLSLAALTGANVFSDLDIQVTTDTLGHVTATTASYTTRVLTAGDLSAYTQQEVNDNFVNTTGDVMTGKFNIEMNPGLAPTYSSGHLELRSTNGDDISMGFHRAGFTACQLRHELSGLILSGTSPTVAADLYVTGNITAGIDVIALSDERLKDDIQIIPDAMDKVKQLRGVTFTRNDQESVRRYTGVIAQDVQAVLPEAVSTGNDDAETLSVSYGNMVGLLIEAIKEQQIQIDELKAQINK